MNTYGTARADLDLDTTRHADTRRIAARDAASSASRTSALDPRKISSGLLLFAILACATTATAALRDYTVKWIPSGSTDVDRYVLSVGTAPGSYSEEFDLGLPDVVGGQMRYVMELEGSVDLYLSLRAVNAATLYSSYSNEIVLAKAEPAPPGPDDLGVVSIDGLAAVVTGGVSVSATAQGITESVLFLIDGQQVRVDSAPPYTLSGDAGNVYDTAALLSDGDHTITAVAFSADGGAGVQGGAVSQAFVVQNAPILPPPPGPGPGGGGGGDLVVPAIVGLVAAANGEISVVDLEGGVTEVHIEQLAANGDLRPAWCDLNGDEQVDLLIGFGPGSDGDLLVLHMQDHQLVSAEVLDFVKLWKPRHRKFARTYAAANGETYPACGDIDGDGLSEIVLGLGHEGGGKVIFLDDVNTGFALIDIKTVVSGLNAIHLAGADASSLVKNATAIPAMGDIDGDGLDELVIGRGPGAIEQIAVFDDFTTGLEALRAGQWTAAGPLEVPGAASLGADGTAWPALGDVDGDGRDEILVGLGEGSGGRLFVFDDAVSGFRQIANDQTSDGAFVAGDEAYREANGQLIPSVGDVDGDGRAEVAVGFGVGADERVQLLDDAEQGFVPHPNTVGLDGMIDPQLGLLMTPALQR